MLIWIAILDGSVMAVWVRVVSEIDCHLLLLSNCFVIVLKARSFAVEEVA